eukprot:GHVP01021161.1.p1 GENE.GHVP01021161.1~~GHVP01021161.1.p1  ORF type:complete len:422 (+),score=62.67 GHVP01021161.1:308-1573(+)
MGFKKINLPYFDIQDSMILSGVKDSVSLVCPILLENLDQNSGCAACGHFFSSDGWRGFLENTILECGPYVAFTTCPHIKETTNELSESEKRCPSIVPLRIWRKYLDHNSFENFYNILLGHFAQTSKRHSFCPECHKIHKAKGNAALHGPVCCSCGKTFCFKCGREPHNPVLCEVAELWDQVNRDEKRNAEWILAKTKSCPSCGISIEKNQGCKHMKCLCTHQFCWCCKKNWESNHACNEFEGDPNTKVQDARGNIERFVHFFERFQFHQEAATKHTPALILLLENRLKGLDGSKSKFLKKEKNENDLDLTFLEKTKQEIVECQQILKWSYAFGYLAVFSTEPDKKLFFFHQVTLETTLDSFVYDLKNFMFDSKMNAYDGINEIKERFQPRSKPMSEFKQKFIQDFEEKFSKVFLCLPKAVN